MASFCYRQCIVFHPITVGLAYFLAPHSNLFSQPYELQIINPHFGNVHSLQTFSFLLQPSPTQGRRDHQTCFLQHVPNLRPAESPPCPLAHVFTLVHNLIYILAALLGWHEFLVEREAFFLICHMSSGALSPFAPCLLCFFFSSFSGGPEYWLSILDLPRQRRSLGVDL